MQIWPSRAPGGSGWFIVPLNFFARPSRRLPLSILRVINYINLARVIACRRYITSAVSLGSLYILTFSLWTRICMHAPKWRVFSCRKLQRNERGLLCFATHWVIVTAVVPTCVCQFYPPCPVLQHTFHLFKLHNVCFFYVLPTNLCRDKTSKKLPQKHI